MKKVIITVVVIALLASICVFTLSGCSKLNEWKDKFIELVNPEDGSSNETEEGAFTVIVDEKQNEAVIQEGNGVILEVVRLSSNDGSSVSSYQLTATIRPEELNVFDISWSMEFEDGSTENIENYLSLTYNDELKHQVNINLINRANKAIFLKALVAELNISATCKVDFMQVPSSAKISFKDTADTYYFASLGYIENSYINGIVSPYDVYKTYDSRGLGQYLDNAIKFEFVNNSDSGTVPYEFSNIYMRASDSFKTALLNRNPSSGESNYESILIGSKADLSDFSYTAFDQIFVFLLGSTRANLTPPDQILISSIYKLEQAIGDCADDQYHIEFYDDTGLISIKCKFGAPQVAGDLIDIQMPQNVVM